MAKAILLDWDKTLCVSRFWEHWQQLYPVHHETVQQRLFKENRALVHDWMRGKYRSEDIAQFLSSHLHAQPKDILSELQESCRGMKLIAPKILDYVAVARTRGIWVAIATDNMDTFSRWTVPALNLRSHFDRIINSADIGALKKDLSPSGSLNFFQSFFNDFGLQPSDCVLIDDGHTLGGIVEQVGMQYRLVDDQHTALNHMRALLAV